MIEIEQKYRQVNHEDLRQKLNALDAFQDGDDEFHEDVYFNHPSRDFAVSKEAFRVRRINGQAWMTYKGQKMPGSIKARREIEVPIGTEAKHTAEFEDALVLLGFRRVAVVKKQRQTYRFADPAAPTIAVDLVDGLGAFAELEMLASREDQVDVCRRRIRDWADRLGLSVEEPESYLSLLLEGNAGSASLSLP